MWVQPCRLTLLRINALLPAVGVGHCTIAPFFATSLSLYAVVMALSYGDIVSGLESEFFLAKIRRQVAEIDDPAELRLIVVSLVELLQAQRDTFLSFIDGDDTDLTGTGLDDLFGQTQSES
jgi:hypothetical protein